MINIDGIVLRNGPYFKFLASHLKNTNKQTSEQSATFQDDSYALFFFQKILRLKLDKRNAVTKT